MLVVSFSIFQFTVCREISLCYHLLNTSCWTDVDDNDDDKIIFRICQVIMFLYSLLMTCVSLQITINVLNLQTEDRLWWSWQKRVSLNRLTMSDRDKVPLPPSIA